MHDIEPYHRWRDLYVAAEDRRSPFYGRKYSERYFTNVLYNFYLHPQWDAFGSPTLYAKILYADYDEGYALIELIGEWNDTLHNDIMYLKREIADPLQREGIHKFVFFCENVLNFHASDEDYYAEWAEEVREEGGWVALLNTRRHVEEELIGAHLDNYIYFGEAYNAIPWRTQKPESVYETVGALINRTTRRLGGW
ncbi:MAG: hypothetical protein NZM43_07110 [Saprospiraceae bacterium]|nr:hypothetical protein [Saprospiraceae bacterium]MDW8484078.1 hypothetical protein [Saprospiraceae bacterium]